MELNVQSLHARLHHLWNSLKQSQQLITRLSKLTSQVGASPSNPDEGNARVDLSAEIHQCLKEQEEEFELLRQEAEDHTNNPSWSSVRARRGKVKGKEREDLAAQVARFGQDLKIAQIQFRKAQLTAKRGAEAARRKEREVLFLGIHEGDTKANTGYARRKGSAKLSQEELLLNASSDVTAVLRRTHDLMSAGLERSQFAKDTLENSTKDLTSLSESYTNLDTLLTSSRSLISTLVHSQKSDTWYLQSAFFILCATIGWLAFRRLLYGPGWWILYFPLRLLWKFLYFTLQLIAAYLAALTRAPRANGQSKALEQASDTIETRFAHTSITSREAGISIIKASMPAPSVELEDGGDGANAEASRTADRSMSGQTGDRRGEGREEGRVGAGKKQETELRERSADERPNPKKRMWEEQLDDNGHGQKGGTKDEL